MNVYVACLIDTLARLIEEARECDAEVARSEGQAGRAYELGRAEALAQSLHTWKNQFETFGLLGELEHVGQDLLNFCRDRELP